MLIDTKILRFYLKANKLIYEKSENLARFEEALEVIECVWTSIDVDNNVKVSIKLQVNELKSNVSENI
jgi:hypothetical protein